MFTCSYEILLSSLYQYMIFFFKLLVRCNSGVLSISTDVKQKQQINGPSLFLCSRVIVVYQLRITTTQATKFRSWSLRHTKYWNAVRIYCLTCVRKYSCPVILSQSAKKMVFCFEKGNYARLGILINDIKIVYEFLIIWCQRWLYIAISTFALL